MKSPQLKSSKSRNLVLSLIGLICSFTSLWAQQSSTVTSHNEVVDKVQRTGLKVSIAFGDRKVKDAWES